MKKLKKLWNLLTTVLVLLMVLLAALLAGPRLVGLHIFAVLSGSMEPEIPTGSAIYVKIVKPETLEPGDVITYLLSADTVSTHRITRIETGEDGTLRFATKGDANDIEDATLVHSANVIGTPVFTIPRLGFLAQYVQTQAGVYRLISVAAFVALLVVLPDLFAKEEKKKQEPLKKEPEPVPQDPKPEESISELPKPEEPVSDAPKPEASDSEPAVPEEAPVERSEPEAPCEADSSPGAQING